eukprot:scaffold468_cov216-Pinguiococcus_pyrenoidosus.AAC.1
MLANRSPVGVASPRGSSRADHGLVDSRWPLGAAASPPIACSPEPTAAALPARRSRALCLVEHPGTCAGELGHLQADRRGSRRPFLVLELARLGAAATPPDDHGELSAARAIRPREGLSSFVGVGLAEEACISPGSWHVILLPLRPPGA